MIYQLVRELAADGIASRLTCWVLGFAAQGYYRWRKHPSSHRDHENAYLSSALVDAHRNDSAFGYRFLADELERKAMAIGERWFMATYSFATSEQAGQINSGSPTSPSIPQKSESFICAH